MCPGSTVLCVQEVIRAGDYTVPDAVQKHIAAIFGLHGLPLPPRKLLRDDPGSPAHVTPTVLTSTYNISGVTPKNKTRQAVAEFQGQLMEPSDLSNFFKQYVPHYKPGVDDKVSHFVGDKGTGSSGVESSLDIEYIMGVSPGVKTDFYYEGGNDFCAGLAKWTQSIIDQGAAAPLVHSVSYGWQGSLDLIGCGSDKIQVVDDAFAKLAAMGVSMIIASGDSGSGYSNHDEPTCNYQHETELVGTVAETKHFVIGSDHCCEAAKGKAGWTFYYHSVLGNVGKCTIFSAVTGHKASKKAVSGKTGNPHPELWPSWPASSPWVTAVGATRFVGQKVGAEEMATDQFGSGGGFSKQFNASAWQTAATKAYLASAPLLPPPGSFPVTGRGTPDVSALGEGYMVLTADHSSPVGGTSASTPAFAGMVGLLNEARLQAGKKPMGFLNPWLYQHPECFTDIVKGNNRIGRGTITLKYGYNATKGWDPVTGLGTPQFDKLLAVAMA